MITAGATPTPKTIDQRRVALTSPQVKTLQTDNAGTLGSGVAAVVLNVTAVSPQAAGFITVWPSGLTRTNTSNLNFQVGQNIPNTVVVPVGLDGKIQLFNGSTGAVHLIVDITGYTLSTQDQSVNRAVTLAQGSTLGLDMTNELTRIETLATKAGDSGGVSVSLSDSGVIAVAAAASSRPGATSVDATGTGCAQNQCGIGFRLHVAVVVTELKTVDAGTEQFSQPSPDRIAHALVLPSGGKALADEVIVTLGSPQEVGNMTLARALATEVGG